MSDADEIPDDVVDLMMVKCGRRCCICRRFKPTHLQVHHIVLRSKGGTDDEDNLIVICLTCHTDAHSKVPFTRRFTENELKLHRNTVVDMVARAVFPEVDSSSVESGVRIEFVTGPVDDPQLSPEAIDILLKAAFDGNQDGMVVLTRGNTALSISVGGKRMNFGLGRDAAKYRAALDQLEGDGLLQPESEVMFNLSAAGWIKADELFAAMRHAE